MIKIPTLLVALIRGLALTLFRGLSPAAARAAVLSGAALLALALFLCLPEPPASDPSAATDNGQAALSDGQRPGLRRPVSREQRFLPGAGNKGEVRLMAVGDVMLGSDHEDELPDHDILAKAAPILRRADLALANLEGPLTNATACRKAGGDGESFAFRTPPGLGRRLRAAGLSLASLANNHALDFGEAGRRQTEETLDALNIGWSGRPGTFALRTVRGTRVGFAAFAPYATSNTMLDLDRAGAFIAGLAARCDLLVVSMHAGAEGEEALSTPTGPETYLGERRGDARAFARMAVDRGAALVVGHGPHVVRGMEMYKGRLIAYSLGNFATAGQIRRSGATGAGAVLEADLTREGGLLRARLIPVRLAGDGAPARDPEATALRLARALSLKDFPDTGAALDEEGFVRPERPARLLALARADLPLLAQARRPDKTLAAAPTPKAAPAAKPAPAVTTEAKAAGGTKARPALAQAAKPESTAKPSPPASPAAATKILAPKAPAQSAQAARPKTQAQAQAPKAPVPALAQAVQAKSSAPAVGAAKPAPGASAKAPAKVQTAAQAKPAPKSQALTARPVSAPASMKPQAPAPAKSTAKPAAKTLAQGDAQRSRPSGS